MYVAHIDVHGVEEGRPEWAELRRVSLANV